MVKISSTQDQEAQKLVHEFNEKEFLTVEEAALYLDLSKSALYKKMSRRELSYYVPGGKKAYFRRDDLDAWVFSKKVDSIEELRRRADEALERRGQECNFHRLATEPTII
jgi:excisionase family DNA binding protein